MRDLQDITGFGGEVIRNVWQEDLVQAKRVFGIADFPDNGDWNSRWSRGERNPINGDRRNEAGVVHQDRQGETTV